MVTALCGLAGCKANAPVKEVHSPTGQRKPATVPTQPPSQAPPAPDDHSVIVEPPDRWVYALKYKDGASEKWIRGSFDPGSNKIVLDMRGVEKFRLDTTKLPINWERLVILRMNGKNSELRRRPFDLLDFEIGDHGNWVVVEP